MHYFFTLSHRVESKRQSTQGQKSSPTPNPYSRKKKWQTDFWKKVGFLGDGLWTGTCECTLLLICSLVTVCMTKQRSSSWKTCPDALCHIWSPRWQGIIKPHKQGKAILKKLTSTFSASSDMFSPTTTLPWCSIRIFISSSICFKHLQWKKSVVHN